MKFQFCFTAFFSLIICFTAYAQNGSNLPKGSLFIIGGGNRSPELVKKMIETAQLNKKDHIAILPMSGSEPDTSYLYIKEDLQPACSNIIANLNFTSANANDKAWLDSLRNAKLIFITGGDQSRFMKIVWNTAIYKAIHDAYKNGATIAGTSAGAAVMSRFMITGNQLLDTVYESTFNKLWDNNIEFADGLGLMTNAIIDQHFVARSRYNRIISAIAKHPELPCIGIDEGTAIIVHHNKITVSGESQVILFSHPKNIKTTKTNLLTLQDLHISIYADGDSFELK